MKLFARHALLASGWAHDVALTIGDDGMIAGIETGCTVDGAEEARGPVVPGMPNLHSHAFQRALAGRTGRRNPAAGNDSFWTWRQAMYAFLDRVDADAFEAIATQAYVEMLEAGYTSVAEFHYVHNDPEGRPYADRAELARRIVAASRVTGIALTLLPVFYAHAGFGGAPPTHGQRRFVHSIDSFSRLMVALADDASPRSYVLGLAAHSLRAVTPEELALITAQAASTAPIHIHAAEQAQEVVDCIASLQARPVQWLLDHANVNERWCLVHATHMTADETLRLASSRATAGLAPSTEADLGDGIFAGREYIERGGSFGIGSDSNTCIDPFAEVRQLEWSQRLLLQQRNVLAPDPVLAIGQGLYAAAALGGAHALAQPVGAIAPGCRADLVILDVDDPALVALGIDDILDAAIFGPCRRPVRDVMVAGRWMVRDGRHALRDRILQSYRAALTDSPLRHDGASS